MTNIDDIPVQIDDCWNRIGVWGNETDRCKRLETVIHCHNCDIYSNAGKLLLDRSLNQGYIADWTRSLSEHKEVVLTNAVSIIIFRIGNEWYALKTAFFKEVTEIRQIHSIPHMGNNIVRGLVNIRGELELCISLGYLFKLTRGEQFKSRGRAIHERLIVVELSAGRYVFPVSEVAGIHHFNEDSIKTPPATIHKNAKSFIHGIIESEERNIGILNEEKIAATLVDLLK